MAITALPTKDTITAAIGWDQCNSRNPQTISAIQVTNAARDSQTQKVDAASEAGRISGAGLLEWMKAPIESSTMAVKYRVTPLKCRTRALPARAFLRAKVALSAIPR